MTLANTQAPPVPCEKCGDRSRLCRCEIDRLLALPESAATVVLPPPALRPDEPACWDLVLARLSAVPEPIDDRLRDDIKRRDAFGVRKYGQRLKAHDGRDPLIDGFQEALDMVAYLCKDDVETEQKYGRWSNEHIETDASFWQAVSMARRLCRQLERRGVR